MLYALSFKPYAYALRLKTYNRILAIKEKDEIFTTRIIKQLSKQKDLPNGSLSDRSFFR